MKLTWDETGSRLFETGVSKVVLFPTDSSGDYTDGVAWSGVISVTGSPSGSDPTPIYANNVKIAETRSFIEFNGTIEAYTYPDEFSDCLGFELASPGMRFALQKPKRFGLAWRSILGNDVQHLDHGYKLHILYGCMAQMSEMPYSSVNQDPEAMTFSWPVSTLPVIASGFLPTSYVEFDSTKTDSAGLNLLEQVLFGTDWTPPRLPMPQELTDIMSKHSDDWIGGIFPLFDEIAYPYNGHYDEVTIGFYPKFDVRSF